MWTGRILGAIFGAMIAGHLGLIIGLLLGFYFDRSYNRFANSPHFSHFFQAFNLQKIQQTFFEATFSIMGYLTKADGRVSEREIAAAKSIMEQMHLNGDRKKAAIAYFNQGKQASFDYSGMVEKLRQQCGHQQMLLRWFLSCQIQVMAADGITPQKQRLLEGLCEQLGFSLNDFIQGARGGQRSYRQSSQSNRSTLSDDYSVLGLSSSASDPEVKKAYRKKMSENHPDKLAAKGLPEEMIKMATEKAQNIQVAYENIRISRGMKK